MICYDRHNSPFIDSALIRCGRVTPNRMLARKNRPVSEKNAAVLRRMIEFFLV